MSYGDEQTQDEHLTTRDEAVAICGVAWIDLVDYSKKPVREQMRLNRALNDLLIQALADRPAAERIVLDTGEGAAVVFPHGPEPCLELGCALRAVLRSRGDDASALRIGMNLGPIRMVRGSNGDPAFMGDGLAAARCVAGFTQHGRIAASRSFYEAMTAVSAQYASCFAFEGTRTDSDVRDHQVYSLGEGEVRPRGLLGRPQAGRMYSGAGMLSSVAAVMRARIVRMPSLATALAVTLILALALMLRPSPDSTFPVSEDSPPTLAAGPAPAETTLTPEPSDSSAADAADTSAQAESAPAAVPDTASGPPPEASVAAGPPRFRVETELRTEPASVYLSKSSPPDRPGVKAVPRPSGVAAQSAPQAQSRVQAAATGAVRLTIVPWGEIYLDGEKLGVAPPLRDVVLEPGVYRFEIRNPGFASLMQVVEVAAGEEVRIRHRFD